MELLADALGEAGSLGHDRASQWRHGRYGSERAAVLQQRLRDRQHVAGVQHALGLKVLAETLGHSTQPLHLFEQLEHGGRLLMHLCECHDVGG